MKKIMSLMLGLTLILGATSAFAAPDTDTTKTDKASKKSSKKKGSKESKDTSTAPAPATK